MIRSMRICDFRKKMADALNRVAYGGERIALTRRDEVIAVLVSYQDLQELRKLRDDPKTVDAAFEKAMKYVIDKNERLYKRLA